MGSLISYPIKDKEKYIVAILSAIKEIGKPTYEQVRDQMEKELIDEKKAKILINQMAKTKDLALLAKKGNATVVDAEITFSNPAMGNVGYEPEIVGSLFSKIYSVYSTNNLKLHPLNAWVWYLS